MVSSLQSIVLYSVHVAVLFDMLKILHHLPLGQPILRALFRRCGHQELRDWAKTLLWDHPIARKLDHEVHRRRIVGESHFFFISPFWGWVTYTPFFEFLEVFPGLEYQQEVLWPVHDCILHRQCRMSWAARYWGPTMSRSFF